MMAARRTTRFITALAFAGLMLGSSPLAPSSLSASAETISISRSAFCEYLAQIIAFLEAQQALHPSQFRAALIAYLQGVELKVCGV